jgi:F-type H+-transporting ATPase subunit alpha
MKKVAGSIRINLANYRELEAFAQFGSDLDTSSKKRLERGRKTVELLKQDVHQLFDMPSQIISIYALSNGMLDDLDIKQIKPLEREIKVGLDNDKNGILLKKFINENKTLPEKKEIETFIYSLKKVLK